MINSQVTAQIGERIVVRIEELTAKMNQARALRQTAMDEVERLLVCMAHRHDLPDTSGSITSAMGSL
jgi:hypothetical protein